jgi:uncharacterized protein (DUF433 family)
MPITLIIEDRIAGTRITVYDVLHYLESGDWQASEIAEVLQLTPEQVQAAIHYIDEHKERVMAVHRRIEERIARGNPPEVEAHRAATRRRMEAWLASKRQAANPEVNGEGHPGGR